MTDNDGTTSTAQDPDQTVTTEATAQGEEATATATVTGEQDGSDRPADEAGDATTDK